MSEPNPVTRLFGAALIAVGFLMMLLCGGCGAAFMVFFVIDGLAHPNNLVQGIMMPLFVGGVPALIGLGLFVAGRNLRAPPPAYRPERPADGSKPPPAPPPQV